MAALFEFHAWIENPIRQIDQKIHARKQERIQEHEPHRERVIACRCCLYEMPAQTGNRENPFDDDRTGKNAGHRGAKKRYDGQQRGWQRMAKRDRRLAQALARAVRT